MHPQSWYCPCGDAFRSGLIGKLVEEGRVAVRQARTDAMAKIKKVDKVPEDEKTRAEKDVQKHTDEATKQIEEQLKAKEAEILAV